jgi:hypothetical protein
MKNYITRNVIKLAALLVLTALLGLAAPAARAAEVNDNIYNYLQLLRSDMNSLKVELVNSIMKLSAEDAKKFWPIYRDYENELGKLSINRVEMITEFVQSHKDGTFDDAKAKDMAKRWFKSQRARLDLLEKYHGKIETTSRPFRPGSFSNREPDGIVHRRHDRLGDAQSGEQRLVSGGPEGSRPGGRSARAMAPYEATPLIL